MQKPFTRIMLIINILSLIIGVTYTLYGNANIFWNIFGLIIIAAFLGNIILAYLDKESEILSYWYLATSTLSMMVVPFVNTFVSLTPDNQRSQSLLSIVLIFSLFTLGALIAACKLSLLPKEIRIQEKLSVNKSENWLRKAARLILSILLYAGLFSGLFIVFNLLRKYKDGVFEVIVPEYSLFYAIAFLGLGTAILKRRGEVKRLALNMLILTVTLLIFIVCMLPLAATPFFVKVC